MERLDQELAEYFSKSRKFKAARKNGAILVVDDHDRIFKVLNFLNEECGLGAKIYHHRGILNAKEMIGELGGAGVRAVIIGSKVSEGEDGESFIECLSETYSMIPVWVDSSGLTDVSTSSRSRFKVGFFNCNGNTQECLEALGFPIVNEKAVPSEF